MCASRALPGQRRGLEKKPDAHVNEVNQGDRNQHGVDYTVKPLFYRSKLGSVKHLSNKQQQKSNDEEPTGHALFTYASPAGATWLRAKPDAAVKSFVSRAASFDGSET